MKIQIKVSSSGYSIETTLREILETVEKVSNDHPDISYDDVEVIVECQVLD